MGEGAAVMDLDESKGTSHVRGWRKRELPDKVAETSKSNIDVLNGIGKENDSVEDMKWRKMFS